MRATPELAYPDLEAARGFWRSLGFTITDHDTGFAFATRDGVELHLFASERGGGSGVYLHVPDVDDEHRRWAAAGAEPTPVADQPWGMREFSVTDPGGNRIRVGRPLP